MCRYILNGIRRYIRNDDGATAVEFGLVSIAFLALLFAIMESGRLFLTWNAFQYSLENAARAALVDDTLSDADIEAMISDELASFFVAEDSIDIDVTFPEISGIEFVQVDGTYTFQPIVPFLPDSWSQFDLETTARLPRP